MAFRPDWLPARLMAFFRANPAEELTPRQIADKFDVSPRTVANVLSRLSQAGLLENVRVARLPSKGRFRAEDEAEQVE